MSLTKDQQELRRAKVILDSKIKASEKGDLVPFRNSTVDLVYGGMDYARSVFGTQEITRTTIVNYFDNARTNWSSVEIPQGTSRHQVTAWCKENGIKPLHYYTPMSERTIWFKEDNDLFVFALKFGVN
jgi:hypothetical protein